MENSVMREKKRKREKESMKEQIMNSLPILNAKQIRRYRIPYHSALCLELEEDECVESSKFIHELIEYQEEIRQLAGPDSYIWHHPKLVDDKKHLNILYNSLKHAEKQYKGGHEELQIEALIHLGVTFTKESFEWYWIAEMLLVQAVSISYDFHKDGGKREAIARYIYGRFLLNQQMDPESARFQLSVCRVHCAGKPWNAEAFLGPPQRDLYIECSSLLYKALLIISQDLYEEDPLRGARLCLIAEKRAKDAKEQQGIADCLMQVGLLEMKGGDADSALKRFHSCLDYNDRLRNHIQICECRIQIALAYGRTGETKEAFQQLDMLMKFARDNNLFYYYGQAHRFMGELYLNQAKAALATPLLIKAINIFHDLDDYDNREQVKNLAAISAGQELLPRYIDLILSCGTQRKISLQTIKLIKWKDCRNYWDENDNMETFSVYHRSDASHERLSLALLQNIFNSSYLDREDTFTIISQQSAEEEAYFDEYLINHRIIERMAKTENNMMIDEDFIKTQNQ